MMMRRKTKCKHETVTWVTSPHITDHGRMMLRTCATCGATLSLGPSNDEPEEVKVEMRAAEIAACKRGDVDYLRGADEASGNLDYFTGADRHDDEDWHGWNAAWLAAHMRENDDRAINGWPWDPTRPIAGQYEEWAARRILDRAMLKGDPATLAEDMAERGCVDETIRADLGLVAVDLVVGDEPRSDDEADYAERAAIAGMTAARHAERDACDLQATNTRDADDPNFCVGDDHSVHCDARTDDGTICSSAENKTDEVCEQWRTTGEYLTEVALAKLAVCDVCATGADDSARAAYEAERAADPDPRDEDDVASPGGAS